MQITLTIPDTKADSFLDVLRHISYVEIVPSDAADHLSSTNEEDDDDEEYGEEDFYEELKEAVNELNEVLAGQKQLQTLGEFLDEYQSRTHC